MSGKVAVRAAALLSAFALSIGMPLVSYATAVAEHVDDGCNWGGTPSGDPFFYADGPPQYWWDANYSGGSSVADRLA